MSTEARSGRRPCLPSLTAAPSRVQAETPATTPKSRLWLWIVALCALQLAAWTAWFVIAAHHQVAEVPLTAPAVR